MSTTANFTFSLGGGYSSTRAEAQTVPLNASTTIKDSDLNLSGGFVESTAGPLTPTAGSSVTTTSTVGKVSEGSPLSVKIVASGPGVKGTGSAKHGAHYTSASPVAFVLDIDELELEGEYATIEFRLEQPEHGDHLRELSDEFAPASIGDEHGFERVAAHLTLFRLQLKWLQHGGGHRLQVHTFVECDYVTATPELSSRDFDFDAKTGTARFIGHLDEQGNRVRSIDISIDPGRTGDDNNLIISLLGTQSSRPMRTKPSQQDQTVAT